jgi:phosphocarrier protein HPr
MEKKIKMNLQYGLHARPSSHIIVRLAPLKLDSATLTYKDKTADLKSILSIMSLFVEVGAEVIVNITGPDQEQAFQIVESIFNEEENQVIYKK